MSAILVVGDNEAGRGLTAQLLSDAGYQVVGATSGEEALSAASAECLAVVLDVDLPDLDGFQLCRILKSQTTTRDLPVVHCTTATGEDVKHHVKALELGADAYISKPVIPEVLLATLRAQIAGRQAKLELAEARERLALSERLLTVGTLAAGVAHEINNPLASVLANVEYAIERLARAEDGADAKTVKSVAEALVDVRDSTERVRRVVQDLQVFSRSRLDAEGPVDVRALVENTLRIAKTELRYRCQLVEHYEEVPEITANEHRLGQVFLNLVLNAVHAIEPGYADDNEVSISVTCDGEFVSIEVRDTGPGMPAEVTAHIFDPFFTTKAVGQGMGLGLAIAHRLVESMGGSIAVDSVVNEGTTMRVRLPLRAAKAAPQPTAPIETAPGERVLIVDDEPAIFAVMERVLEGRGEVTMLRDPTEALQRIRDGARFDAILCDVMMPNITGPDFASMLAEISKSQSACLGFITGGVFAASVQDKLDNLGRPILKKPFTPTQAREFISQLAKPA